jgi:hypothetical protein
MLIEKNNHNDNQNPDRDEMLIEKNNHNDNQNPDRDEMLKMSDFSFFLPTFRSYGTFDHRCVFFLATDISFLRNF